MAEIPMIRRDNGAAMVTLGPDPVAFENLRDCPECDRKYNQFVNPTRCPDCGHQPGANGGDDA